MSAVSGFLNIPYVSNTPTWSAFAFGTTKSRFRQNESNIQKTESKSRTAVHRSSSEIRRRCVSRQRFYVNNMPEKKQRLRWRRDLLLLFFFFSPCLVKTRRQRDVRPSIIGPVKNSKRGQCPVYEYEKNAIVFPLLNQMSVKKTVTKIIIVYTENRRCVLTIVQKRLERTST